MEKLEILRSSVQQLKDKLTELGLPTTGRKAVLQDSLCDHFGISIDEEGIEIEEELEATLYGEAEALPPQYSAHTTFTLRDIQDSLHYFDGSGQPEIEAWINEFEENAFTVKWNDLQKFIYAKQLVKGAALAFIKSQHISNWANLKKSLIHEFGRKLSAIEIHRALQSRKKNHNETFLEYLYSLIAISNTIDLDEKSIVEYFIDGVNDDKHSKAILYEATSLQELKIKIYEKIKTKTFSAESNFNNSKKGHKKCKNCPHLSNHFTSDCRKSKFCNICNRFGHKTEDCPDRQKYQHPNYNSNFHQRNNYQHQHNQNQNYNLNYTNQQRNNYSQQPNNTRQNT